MRKMFMSNKALYLLGFVGVALLLKYSYNNRKQQKIMMNVKYLSQEFGEAAKHALTLKGLNQDQKLSLYALYKQATQGDCKTSKPLLMDMAGCAKWEAWDHMRGMSQEEAVEKYIVFVINLGQYLKQQQNKANEDKENPQGFGLKVSTMNNNQEADNQQFIKKFNIKSDPQLQNQVHLDQEKQILFDQLEILIKESKNEELEIRLQELQTKVDFKLVLQNLNEAGISLLHISIENQNQNAFDLLLPLFARLNLIDIQDNVSGMTSLHYGVQNGDERMIRLLIKNGADVKFKDFNGDGPFDDCSMQLKKLLD